MLHIDVGGLPGADVEVATEDVFRCQVFQFSDTYSVEYTLQCIAQAFGNSQSGTGKDTGDPLTYLFEVSASVSERDVTKGVHSVCHQGKEGFKLRAGHTRQVSLTITQTSTQQMIVESAFGLLVGQGHTDSGLTALELSNPPRQVGKSLTLTGTWTAPPDLRHETPKGTPALKFTVAVDVQIAGLTNTLRITRDFKVRVYKAHERFYSLHKKGGQPPKLVQVNLESKEHDGQVQYSVGSVTEKDAERNHHSYMDRFNKYLKSGGKHALEGGDDDEDEEGGGDHQPVNHKLCIKRAQHLDSRCVLLSDPSTFGAGGPNQNTCLESRFCNKEV